MATAVTERWVGHGQPWLFVLGVSYFQQPPRAGGLTYPTQVGVAPSRPEMGVYSTCRGESPPLGNSSAGGDEYVHVAGTPSEKALVRGA